LTNSERAARRLHNDWHYALPTEAQWEYACRAGSTTRFSFGDDESMLGEFAWWGSDQGNTRSEKYAHRVGLKKANRWGFHDMHGNVYEWCQDAYESKLRGGIDPLATADNSVRVYKGGDWGAFDASLCRIANRGRGDASGRGNDLGFRVSLQPVAKVDSARPK
jgi:formylglycine-generating enzyme required for sulfatase activity